MVTAAQMRERYANRKRRRVRKADGGGLTGWVDLPVDADAMAALRQRRAVRPVGGRKEGRATTVPERLVKDILTLPQRAGEAAVRYGETGEYNAAPIMEAAMMTMGAGAPFAQQGAAGIFGGKLAKTADHAALARAEEMAAKGANREQIWSDTGWFKGADGKWRFEIPDDYLSVRKGYGAGLDPIRGEAFGKYAPKIEHDDLISAYPGKFDYLAHDVKVARGAEPSGRFMPEGAGRNEEYFYSDKPVLPQLFVEAPTTRQARSIASHELQHAVQGHEGFAKGANPQSFHNELWGESHDRQMLADKMYDMYRRAAGEVEARNVQKRLNMTPEQRRAKPPWETEDVPLDRQIVREGYAEGGFVLPSDDTDAGFTLPSDAAPPTPKGILEKTVEPITSYPETYTQMNREAREQVGHGIEQLTGGEQHFDPVRDAYPPDSTAWRLAKGAGNVAMGGLGYVASPVNAALRTVVGKPVEEATGIPKEYTEFATSLAVPGIGMTRVPSVVSAPSRTQTIAEASQRLNVPISRAAASESIPVQASAGALKEVPFVGTPLVKSSQNSIQAMDRAVADTVSGYGSGQPLAAGQGIIDGIEGWVGGRSEAVATRLYDNVDNLVDQIHQRPLHATERVVSDIMAQRANARISGASPAINEVLEAIQAPGGMNYAGVKDLRSYIREMTPEEMVAKGINKAEAKRIYGALTQDLRGTVLDAGGPDALKSFDRATSLYETIAEKRKALAKIIGVKADATPERALARIMEMATSKGGGNYNGLVQARRAIGPENWDEVTSAIVAKMGRDKPGADFSGDRFKTAWDAMPDNTRRLVFNSTNKPGLAKSVEDIMTLSDAHKRLMKYGNPSGTGRVATFSGLVTGLWAEPVTALSTAVSGNVMARVLASPVAAKQAAKWSLVYSNAAKNPSPGRIAVLSQTSENLAHAINRELGTKLSGPDFLRGIQGPVPARSEDQQQP